jgi:hypothetical protein
VVDAEIKAELYDEVEGKRVVLIFIGREIIGSSQRVVALARQGKVRHAPERLTSKATLTNELKFWYVQVQVQVR